jgi:methyl-accepting chemotaxis protein
VLNEKKEITSNLNDPNGNNVLSAMAPVQIEGKTWVLVSEKQNSEILEPVRELLKQVFLYASIVLLGVVFVGIALSKKLLSPIIMASETLVQVCNSLNTDSNHLTQSASTLAESSKDQANNLQTTVQAVHEISSTIEQNTNNAKNSEALAKHSLEAAEKGREVITQMMQSMSDINSGNQEILLQVEDSNKQINEILVMISEIGNKTKLINDIVFQTKLLSFNASVEAARAGENGKGFAVVAEEIGNLAQSSGNSAKEISDLLSVSITKVESIIRDTTQKIGNVSTLGRERVKTGQETAKKCSESFDEIVKSFNQVAVLVSEISHASNEQNLGMSEINEAMIRLNAGTDKSTQIASDSSEAATKLESRAKTLEEVVQNIQEVIHGVKST